MIGIDDGIWSGNFNAADLFFIIGMVLALLAAVLYAAVHPPTARWAPVALSVAVASVALAWAIL